MLRIENENINDNINIYLDGVKNVKKSFLIKKKIIYNNLIMLIKRYKFTCTIYN